MKAVPESESGRQCGKCKTWRTFAEFYKNHRSPCIPCRNEWFIGYREKRKKLAFDHYGAICVCCGEETYEFLTFDHIDGGGNKERTGGVRKEPYTYERVIKEGFPDRFQVLCFNCNWGKHKCGVCPHQRSQS